MPLSNDRVKEIFNEKLAEVQSLSYDQVEEHIRFLADAAHVIQIQISATSSRRTALIDRMDVAKINEIRQYDETRMNRIRDEEKEEKSQERKTKGKMDAAVQSVMKLFGFTEEQAISFIKKGQK